MKGKSKGLGDAGKSLFNKTEISKINIDSNKVIQEQVNNWGRHTFMVKDEDKEFIRVKAFYEKKELKEVLAEIIEYYRQANPNSKYDRD